MFGLRIRSSTGPGNTHNLRDGPVASPHRTGVLAVSFVNDMLFKSRCESSRRVDTLMNRVSVNAPARTPDLRPPDSNPAPTCACGNQSSLTQTWQIDCGLRNQRRMKEIPVRNTRENFSESYPSTVTHCPFFESSEPCAIRTS